MHKSEAYKTAIVGARGYSGLELARILLRHPQVELVTCFAGIAEATSTFSLSDYLPEEEAKNVTVRPIAQLDSEIAGLKAVFLATPHEVSAELAPRILAQGVDVIDLSGAFRLQAGSTADQLAHYRSWYKMEHPSIAWVGKAFYGLSPWGHTSDFSSKSLRSESVGPTLVANPGCYATSVLMGILPLLREGLIDPATLVIDAKSGASGAGRKAAENILFTEVDGDCLPYRIGKHQHSPEVRQFAEKFSGVALDPFFTTSLLPVRRGIIAGIYAKLVKGASSIHVKAALGKAYEDYPLIRFGSLQELGATAQSQVLSLKRIQGTPKTHVFFEVVGDKLYLFSLIDNLLKGAASQAVENFNWLNGLPVDSGLTGMEGVL